MLEEKIFNFELSDHDGNNYFYEIVTNGYLQDAEVIAQKHFAETFGHKASRLEENHTGFPVLKCF